jgi:hypothetical protein
VQRQNLCGGITLPLLRPPQALSSWDSIASVMKEKRGLQGKLAALKKRCAP